MRDGRGPGIPEAENAYGSTPRSPSRECKASTDTKTRLKRTRYDEKHEESPDYDSGESSESSDSSDPENLSQDSALSNSAMSDSAESANEGGSDGGPTSRSENEEYVRFEVEDKSNRRLTLPEGMPASLTEKFSTLTSDKLFNEKILEKKTVPSTSAVQAP